MGVENGVSKLLKVVIIEVKLTLEGPVGKPLLTAEPVDGLGEDILEAHDGSPSVYRIVYPDLSGRYSTRFAKSSGSPARAITAKSWTHCPMETLS